jgi:hypothetical protein
MSITFAGIVIGLFARSVIKSGGDVLLNGGQSLLSLFKKELIAATAEEMPHSIKGIVNRLNLKRSSKEKLLSSGNIIDLAGLAWADLLNEQPDELVSKHTQEPNAQVLTRRLDPFWFIDAITSPRASEITFEVGSKSPAEKFDQELLEKLSSIVCTEIRDELQLDDDVDPLPLVQRVVSRLPQRVYDLWLTVPGIELRITRLNTEATLKYVSGSADKEDIFRALRALAQKLIDSLDTDVFGRTSAQPNEPPLLPHRVTYVEPEATLKRARTSSKIPLEKGPAKLLVRKTWILDPQTQLAVMHAPFGYGKSLTFRDFAAELAGEWQKDPDNAPFPILLRCPETLAGHVSTLKAAVQNSLEKQTGLAPTAIERIWSTLKLILLLDSFDEVHMSEKEAKAWFEEMQQISNGDRVRVVVASRPHAFSSRWLGPHDWEVELQPFDEIRGQRWLDSVAGRLGPENLTFREVESTLDATLAGTPILLVMAAYGWNENAKSTPNSKAAIYRRFIERISAGKWSDVQEAHQVVQFGLDTLAEVGGLNAFRKALRLLAWDYLRAEQRAPSVRDSMGLSRRHVSDLLQANFSGIGEDQVDAITRSLCLSLFMHKSVGTESVVFTHRSFREFLCAEHIVDNLRHKRVGAHYLSNAWRILAEAALGDAELTFAGELLQELDSHERSQIIKQLDEWYRERRSIFFKEKEGLQIEKADPNIEVGLVNPNLDRGRVFRANTEELGLVGRKVSPPERTIGLHSSVAYAERFDADLLDDDTCRVSHIVVNRFSQGVIWAYGYHVATGNVVSISPIFDLESYREHLKQAPELMLPIIHVSKKYFACSVPGMHSYHFLHGMGRRRLLALAEFGKVLKRADEKGFAVPSMGLSRPARTPAGFMLSFASGEKTNPKWWWSNRAQTYLIEQISDISDHVHILGSRELISEVHKQTGVLMNWAAHSWDEIIASFEAAIAAIRAYTSKEAADEPEPD